jgi:hypothetical protein
MTYRSTSLADSGFFGLDLNRATGHPLPPAHRHRATPHCTPDHLDRQAAPWPDRIPGVLGAPIGTQGIEDNVGAVGHHLHNYEVSSRASFADRIERRRGEQEHR